jgi:hypothetical protein
MIRTKFEARPSSSVLPSTAKEATPVAASSLTPCNRCVTSFPLALWIKECRRMKLSDPAQCIEDWPAYRLTADFEDEPSSDNGSRITRFAAHCVRRRMRLRMRNGRGIRETLRRLSDPVTNVNRTCCGKGDMSPRSPGEPESSAYGRRKRTRADRGSSDRPRSTPLIRQPGSRRFTGTRLEAPIR